VRLGKIYQTQRNDEVMLENYNRSVEVDPAFAPGYLELYNHFSYRDVNRAKEYLDKYIANSDADCNTDLFAADYLFRSGKYSEAITRSGELASGNCGKDIGTRLKMLNAFCYERLGDSINAKRNIDEFMQAEDPAKILPGDYEMAAKITAKFPGSELKAIEYINKAYESDSAGRIGYLLQLVDLYKKTANPIAVAATWDRLVVVKPRPSNVDMYNRAMAHMGIKNYTLADSLWQQYKDKYPDQVYGYTYRIKCNEAQDTSMAQGLAVPHYENMVAFAQRDTVKYKNQMISALYKLVVYYVNVKKDKPKSIEYLTQYLLFDPNNEEARKNLQKLKGG
jgi:tetratricopeptide (TPR) repeat protein